MMQAWYLKPTALHLLERIRAFPPARHGNTETNPLLTNSGYSSDDVASLEALFRIEFNRVYAIVPFPADDARALLESSPHEILAGMFGCPDGLDWADPERAARRAAMATAINGALDGRLAA